MFDSFADELGSLTRLDRTEFIHDCLIVDETDEVFLIDGGHKEYKLMKSTGRLFEFIGCDDDDLQRVPGKWRMDF